jgi:hypothetical protein
MYQWPQNIANGHKIYQMAGKLTEWPHQIPSSSFERPSKISQIGIFGLIMYLLVTLANDVIFKTIFANRMKNAIFSQKIVIYSQKIWSKYPKSDHKIDPLFSKIIFGPMTTLQRILSHFYKTHLNRYPWGRDLILHLLFPRQLRCH